MKNAIAMVLACAGLLFAQPPASTIDTVLVTPVFLRLIDNSNNVCKYVGKVSYTLVGWSNDRFNASLSIISDATGATVPLTWTKGDAGNFDSWGVKSIHFGCTFTGPPSGTFKAKVSVNATKSDTAQFVERYVAALSNADKQTIINGGAAGGVPAVNWQDGPHGVRGAFAYPPGEAMASTFDTAIAEEGGRYKAEDFRGEGYNIMLGTTVNLVRDSRGGRSFESYGEDPFLSGKMGVADTRGCQQRGLMVTIKHYACNNIERARGNYPVLISERALRELYTYQFGIAVGQSRATGIMTAYNDINGVVCASNAHVETDILKNGFGLKGFTMSDWGAGGDPAQSAKAGLDLPEPGTWGTALTGMVPGTIPQYLFDDKARRFIWARYKAGCFDPGYTITQYHDSINNATHYNYMRRATREAMILAKNDGNLLPINRSSGPVKIAVVGLWANQMRWFVQGSALVNPMHITSPVDAIKKIGGANVTVTTDFKTADYAVVCIGQQDTGEGNDRNLVTLLDTQNQFCAQVLAAKPTKTIVFFDCGSVTDSNTWCNAPAILMSRMAGEDHTLAMAEVLFGDYNPAGRNTMTFPHDSAQLPRFGIGLPWDNTGLTKDQYEDAWEGRGYPYYDYHKIKPLFYFGHGLSYTTFAYSNLSIAPAGGYPGDTFHVSVDVKNTGSRDGDEVVQLYLHDEQSNLPRRYKDLRGFARVPLTAGQTKTVTFGLTEQDMEYYDDAQSAWVIEPGPVDVLVGGSSNDIRQQGTITIY